MKEGLVPNQHRIYEGLDPKQYRIYEGRTKT